MADITADRRRYRFLESGNAIALIAISVAWLLCLIFFRQIRTYILDFNIKVEDAYSYVFNLFSIEFGALLALFALFVCKPTQFLERIKATQTFVGIMQVTKITMIFVTVVIVFTFVLGLTHYEPGHAVTLRAAIFLLWIAVSAAATCFYARTVILIFTALA